MVVVELENKTYKDIEATLYITFRIDKEVLLDDKTSIDTSMLQWEAKLSTIKIVITDKRKGEKKE